MNAKIIAIKNHVESIGFLSHKNADSHIHIKVELGDGDGKFQRIK